MRAEFPGTKIFARSYDRGHTLQLLAKDVDYELRETFESAMRFGRETLVAIGIDADRAAIVEDFIRTRDRDRLAVQQAEGIYAGIDLLRKRPTPTPFSEVQHGARALNMEAGELIAGEKEEVEGWRSPDEGSESWSVTRTNGIRLSLYVLQARVRLAMAAAPSPRRNSPRGSTMRHVVVMTATGSIGLMAIFVVDFLNLFYIALLGEQELAAAIGYAGTRAVLHRSRSASASASPAPRWSRARSARGGATRRGGSRPPRSSSWRR